MPQSERYIGNYFSEPVGQDEIAKASQLWITLSIWPCKSPFCLYYLIYLRGKENLQYPRSSATMKISFYDPKHEELANDFESLSKKYDKKGQKNAEEIIATIDALRAANTLFDVPPSYRPHPLKVEYKGCFAVDVTSTHRIIFKPNHKGDPGFRIDKYKSITAISIIDIFVDYH